jgi:hypothetical protein
VGQNVTTIEVSTGELRTDESADLRTRAIAIARRHPQVGAASALFLLLAAAVSANVWWLNSYRKGLPFSIDESGYLQRGVLYQQEIVQHGISGLANVWQRPDIVAPLMPLVAGLVRAATGATPFAMVGTVQIFYAILIIATYLLARHFVTRSWALLIAAVVACLPGALDASRVFLLAEPAAALFVALLAVQLRTRRFVSLPFSVGWGILLGLTSLTRTMVLALLVAPLVVEGTRLVISSPTLQQYRNVAIASVVALGIGGSWYWTSWETVRSYLTTYGYGKLSGSYGRGHPVLSWSWWFGRFVNIIDQDVYVPILFALIIAAIAGGIVLVRRTWTSSESGERPVHAAGLPVVHRKISRVRNLLDNDGFSLCLVLAIAYLVLCTSQNSGSYFELPLVPLIVCIVLIPIARGGTVARGVVFVALLAASGVTIGDQLNLIPAAKWSSVSVGGLTATAFNNSEVDFAGPKLRGSQLGGVYWTDCGGATISCFYGRTQNIDLSYVEAWSKLSSELVSYLYRYSAAQGRTPVVFFAYQGPLLNTNSVSLAAQLRGLSLPIGALTSPTRRNGASLLQQLENPLYGQPNIVLAGIPPSRGARGAWPGSSVPEMRTIEALLRGDGFHLARTLDLPQAQPMGIWWKDR